MKVFIGLGSNLGEREGNIRVALEHLERNGLSGVVVSSLYETDPVGPSQPDFLNAVCSGDTSLEPVELIGVLKKIEDEIGRRPRERWGPREIDLDLLLYGTETIEEKGLVVPHPELTKRAFVLVPLLEISPYAELPSGEPIAVFLEKDPKGVRKLSSGPPHK